MPDDDCHKDGCTAQSSGRRAFDRRPTLLSGQWLYLFGDGAVIYSERENRFAGLDDKGLATYLAMEAGASVDDLRHAGGTVTSGFDTGLDAIYGLTQGIFPADIKEYWPVLNVNASPDVGVGSGASRVETVGIAGIPVSIEYPAGAPEALCRDYFRNCPAESGPPRCFLTARRDADGWVVDVNGREFLLLQHEEQLGLGLMHALRTMMYAETAYDVAFHAAAVAHRNSAILLCAPREAGKSTLAAYLVAHGFELLADEPSFLELDTCAVSSLPLPLSLKEGSWQPLHRELPYFSCGPLHMRSDGVRIRLAHVPSDPRELRARPLARIVFPQYDSSSETSSERLTPLRTLALLNESGLLAAQDLGRERFERFLDLLGRTPAHRIRYSSLENVGQLLADPVSSSPR
jgi:hypothetical protein